MEVSAGSSFLSCISCQFVGSRADQRRACCLLQRIKASSGEAQRLAWSLLAPRYSGYVPIWPRALENHVSRLHSLQAGNRGRPDSEIEHCCKLGHGVPIIPLGWAKCQGFFRVLYLCESLSQKATQPWVSTARQGRPLVLLLWHGR